MIINKESYKKDKNNDKIRLFDFKIFIYSNKETYNMRPTLEEIDKKKSLTITIDREILAELNVKNKSKLINWLLREHLTKNGYEFKNEF